jgi:methyl-accepting chemotaxis protein
VEDKSVTTNEMSRNVAEASEGRNEIVLKITDVAQAAQSTSSGATQTQAAAQELARMAGELHCAVSQFTVDGGMDRHASPRRGGKIELEAAYERETAKDI